MNECFYTGAPMDELNERKFRRKLFQKARKGDRAALATLWERYQVTMFCGFDTKSGKRNRREK